MMKSEHTITQGQLVFYIIQTQIGIALLSLPYTLFKVSKQDAWISILIAGIFVQIFLVIFWLLNSRFPTLTIYEILPKLIGKILGKVMVFLYAFQFTLFSSAVLIFYGHLLKIWVLENTPIFVVILLLVFTGVYLGKQNLRIIARFSVFVSFFLLVLFVLVALSFKDANFLYLLPMAKTGWFTILKGSKEATLAILGFDAYLVIGPFVQGPAKGKLKAVTIANLFVTLFYTYLVVASLAYFSPEEMKIIPEPILYLIKSFSFGVVERTDLVFISIWMVMVTTSFVNYLYIASTGVATLFGQPSHSKFVPYVAGVAALIALFIDNRETIKFFTKFVTNAGMVLVLFLPLILLLISYLTRKKETGVKNY
ncbi:GerAB/ArcD/ProY family transporter [Neobacillus rhizosphaerae]|nr:endospore germination permease [Neobacillus rhizosphaerae]